jgi:DNA polymerase-3 subunit beta
MEFTVSRADLVRELNLSQGVVEKKTTIPILSNVLMEAEGDRVHLTATDLELGIRCSCPARVKKPGSGTIPARRLLDYVRLLPDADVQMKIQENHWASLTCGRSKTRIAGMSRDSFPELPQMPAVLAEIPFGVLTSMISKTVFAISTEESRFTLNGALLVFKKGGLVTSDRLSNRSVAQIVKDRAEAAGFDPTIFSGHSLRAGFVTSALHHGADILRVMDVTRHREVSTLKTYDRRAKAFKQHAGEAFL